MTTKRSPSEWMQQRAAGWADAWGWWTDGGLAFLLITGLAILFLPFSVFNQHAVLTHTVLGLLWLVPATVYTWRHVVGWWDAPMTQAKFTGWVAGAMNLVCVVSGVVLTVQAAFGTRIGQGWRLTHIVTTFGLILFLVPHLWAALAAVRGRSGEPEAAAALAHARVHGRRAAWCCLAGLVLTGGLTALIRPVSFDNEFPADYDLTAYGEDATPFTPSLATTTTGGAFDSRSLAGSASCGTAGCHPQIYAEWLPSAHHYAAMDVAFQAVQGVMAQQNGPVSTRYCGGCHDPISLFSGTKNIGVEQLTALHGYQEGISCLACHAIEQTDVKGNANYVIHQPERYVYELREGALATALSEFVIRAYPERHVETLSRRMFKTPEFCAACHKQFIDQEVNKVGWVQLQNQYDNWRASRWNDPDDPTKTIECRECHMPLADSTDPAAGDAADFNRSADDGKHRSHRFLGGNQFVPLYHKLEGAEEHVELTERWLRGEIEIPELEGRWTEGPAVPISVDAPAEVSPGDAVPLRVHVTNNKVGHDFPTGPLDIIQAWVEVEVTDDAGRLVYHSGTRSDEHVIETGTFMFKAEPVDRYGNLIDRHNLWEMVGVRFKRSLFPGASEVASFEFGCPGAEGALVEDLPQVDDLELEVPADATGLLHVTARLNYRKSDQYLLDHVIFPDRDDVTAPITVVSEAETTIRVRPVAAVDPDPAPGAAPGADPADDEPSGGR